MLTLDFIRRNKEDVQKGLGKRGFNSEALGIIDQVIGVDDRRKKVQTQLDAELRTQKELAKKIGSLYQQGDIDGAEDVKVKVGEAKMRSKELEEEHKNALNQLESLLLSIPNIPHPSVPSGNSEEDNEVIRLVDQYLPDIENGKPHWELAKEYRLLDFELGTKITGSGFPLFRSRGAKLQRSLIAFFLDEAIDQGYEEIIPPLLVNEASARATGQLPDKDGQMYHMERDELFLIPTGEVPITNIFRDVIVERDQFPIKLVGHTPCFRREAGSYGADVKGLNRVHQFDKVEIVQITEVERSYAVLDEMVEHVASLLEKLKLPYRILRLCGGDLGFTSALTYDLEVFSAGQGRWLEVSSVSNFETYQSNRLKVRYKNMRGKKELAHTLNGSALALARIMAAILENYQTPEGIVIPEVLVPYTKFEIIKNN